jgi:hypothetical protein
VTDPLPVMKKRFDLPLAAILLAALLALIGLAAYGNPSVPGEVTITGRLFADGDDLADAVLVVELEEEQCLRSVLLRNGRFNFAVPVGARARLFFVKPGFHTKEVMVDTHNALCSARARKLNDKVRFDVVLERLEEHPRETYAGAVGRIHFVKGTGLMRVWHDGRMVAIVDDGTEDR